MNLKNKTIDELWDMLDKLRSNDYKRYEIHNEIIRRENEMDKKEVLERIDGMIATIRIEREKTRELGALNEEFDCGTQLGIDLLEEWKGELE